MVPARLDDRNDPFALLPIAQGPAAKGQEISPPPASFNLQFW